jgi:4-hydroxybenzoate polyprenyltransferase
MSSSTGGFSSDVMSGQRLRTAARGVGIVFLLVGVAGFIPGITSNYDQLEFAGHESGALLLGIFEVSVLHNIVHLLFGIAGLLLSRTARAARAYLIGGGAIYLLLWIYGLLIDHDTGANFVPVNDADNWLHLVLGIGMIGLGLLLSPRRAVAR